MKSTIKQKFIETYEINLSEEEISDDAFLFGDQSEYGLDSMDVLLFLNLLKKEFNLDVGAISVDDFKTVNNIVAFIEEQAE